MLHPCPICGREGWSRVGPPHCRECYDSELGLAQRLSYLTTHRHQFKDQAMLDLVIKDIRTRYQALRDEQIAYSTQIEWSDADSD